MKNNEDGFISLVKIIEIIEANQIEKTFFGYAMKCPAHNSSKDDELSFHIVLDNELCHCRICGVKVYLKDISFTFKMDKKRQKTFIEEKDNWGDFVANCKSYGATDLTRFILQNCYIKLFDTEGSISFNIHEKFEPMLTDRVIENIRSSASSYFDKDVKIVFNVLEYSTK